MSSRPKRTDALEHSSSPRTKERRGPCNHQVKGKPREGTKSHPDSERARPRERLVATLERFTCERIDETLSLSLSVSLCERSDVSSLRSVEGNLPRQYLWPTSRSPASVSGRSRSSLAHPTTPSSQGGAPSASGCGVSPLGFSGCDSDANR